MGRHPLHTLYAEIPTLACRGRCAEACGPVSGSRVELQRIARRRGRPLDVRRDGMCGALTGGGRCSVYADRPMICRLWGLTEGTRCPHGCVPDGGFISDEQMMALLAESMVRGGDPQGRDLEPMIRARDMLLSGEVAVDVRDGGREINLWI